MATEQLPKLAGVLVEHQSGFSALSTEDTQWVIAETEKAIAMFCEAVRKRKEAPKKQEPLRMTADLDADPSLPFGSAMFDGRKGSKHAKQGQVEFEYRPDEDELYVNGRKLVPFLSELQSGGKVAIGHILQAEAEANSPTNATLADVLYTHQEFIPKKFRDRVWFFRATVFSDSDGNFYVRYLDWDGARWVRGYDWRVGAWSQLGPSASLASEPSRLEPKAS